MASEVSIYNMALTNVGDFTTVATPADHTKQAKICGIHYANCRDRALAAHWWPFATRRRALALSTTEPPEEWQYAYGMPSDCVTPQYLADGGRVRRPEQAIPFTIEDDGAGTPLLLTDQKDAVLVFTARIESPALYPPDFEYALGWLLASAIVVPLSLKPDFRVMAVQEYLRAITTAKARAENGVQRDPPPDGEFVAARS